MAYFWLLFHPVKYSLTPMFPFNFTEEQHRSISSGTVGVVTLMEVRCSVLQHLWTTLRDFCNHLLNGPFVVSKNYISNEEYFWGFPF